MVVETRGPVLLFAALSVASCGSSSALSAMSGADAAPEGSPRDDAGRIDASDAEVGSMPLGDASPEGGLKGLVSGADVVVDAQERVVVAATLEGTLP
jgi:hypothetical protein